MTHEMDQELLLRGVHIDAGSPVEEQAFVYSRKVTNRFANAANTSQLRLVEGEDNGRKIGATLLVPQLPELGYPPVNLDSFNVLLPKVAEALLFSGEQANTQLDYVNGIGGYDYATFAKKAVEIARNPEQESRMVLRVVYGASEEMSFRSLDYLNPALIAMQRLHDIGVKSPQLQVVFANNIGIAINKLNGEKVSAQVQQFVPLAHSFIETFFPDIQHSVIFLEDIPLMMDNVDTSLRTKLIDVIEAARPHCGEFADELIEKGLKHTDDKEEILTYGAAHVVMHDTAALDILVPFSHPICADQEAIVDADTVISFGGEQEKFFYKLRHRMKPHLGDLYNSIATAQIFTNHYVPPYYMAIGGDIPLSADPGTVRLRERRPIVAKAAEYDLAHFFHVMQQRAIALDLPRGGAYEK